MTGKRIWRIWKGMIERCHKEYGKDYDRYGGAGIKVCKRWRDHESGFENFLMDMGDPGEKSKLTLDRRDGTKGYKISNCRWATQIEQHRNRKDNRILTLDGRTQTLAAWAEETGIQRSTISKRIDKYGWSVRRALTTPV